MNSVQNLAVQYQKNALSFEQPKLYSPDTCKPNMMNNILQNMKKEKTIEDIWKDNFKVQTNAHDLSLNVKTTMTWTNQNNNIEEKEEEVPVEIKREPSPVQTPEKEEEPSHHARRPMNAFLIFCKKHRPIVRKKYPTLENRGVTRILGEWWALLDVSDKEAYTNLAKEYKDAFFTANPNFKWYKLPAPPLRPGGGATPRPVHLQKEPVTITTSTETSTQEAEFTPGKLADESQLGLLSSLLNADTYTKKPSDYSHDFQESMPKPSFNDIKLEKPEHEQNNNINMQDALQKTPDNPTTQMSAAVKPLKKRIFEGVDNKNVARNIFNDISTCEGPKSDLNEDMTHQDLVERVVESIYSKQKVKSTYGKMKLKETRTSGRSCKGKRYAEFMRNGKLIKNKRDKRPSDYNFQTVPIKLEDELDSKIESNKTETQTPMLALENTIKRLAERTNVKLEPEDEVKSEIVRQKTISESSEDLHVSSCFNLELRIDELPSLSYETYLQRKRDSKKRKILKKSSSSVSKIPKVEAPPQSNKVLIGSKKRKNKHNITHLQKNDSKFVEGTFTIESDLSGLATLAEIAANTEKINEK